MHAFMSLAQATLDPRLMAYIKTGLHFDGIQDAIAGDCSRYSANLRSMQCRVDMVVSGYRQITHRSALSTSDGNLVSGEPDSLTGHSTTCNFPRGRVLPGACTK